MIQFLHACNFHISSLKLLRTWLFQRPDYLTFLLFTYLLFSCVLCPSLFVLSDCHFTLHSHFTHALLFFFTSKSPCLSVHYNALWITFWRQYVTGRPPGSLPVARRLVCYSIHPRILSDRGSSSVSGSGAQRNNTHHMVLTEGIRRNMQSTRALPSTCANSICDKSFLPKPLATLVIKKGTL